MRKRNLNANEKGGTASWMNTYADMVTLLLCFFVLLFSFSEIDANKFKAIMKSFQGSLGILESGRSIKPSELVFDGNLEDLSNTQILDIEAQKELKGIADDLNARLEEMGFSQQVDIQHNERYVKLNFLDGVLFDSGKADIKPEAIETLNAIGDVLSEYESNRIKIEGHTDNVPMKSYRYPNNWYLSAARAIAVAEYYINEKDFNPKRLSAEGFGEYTPITTNDTNEGRMKNRRVEIKILSSVESQKPLSQ